MTYYSIKSEHLFTTVVDEDKMQAALRQETTQDLLANYRSQGSAFSNPVFGQSARKWSNYVAKELIRRGVTSYFDIFGEVPITVFTY